MKKDNMKHNNKTVIKSNIKNVQSVDKKMKFRKDLPAIILAVCMIFWTVGSLISFVLGARSCSDKTIEASAESELVATTYEPYFDNVESYPSANLYPYPYMRSNTYVQDGITYVFNLDGTINVSGTCTKASGSSVVGIFDSAYLLFMNKQVRLYSPITQPGISLNVQYFNGSTYLYGNTISSVANSAVRSVGSYTRFYSYIAVTAGVTIDQVIKPMISLGSTAYPFIPPLKLVEMYGYNQGYNQGENDGYLVGREDGMKKGDISFLYGATATLDFARYGANDSASGNLYVDGSQVSFSGIISNYTSISNITARIDLAVPTNGRNLYWVAYGNRSAFYDGDSPKVFTAVTSDGSTFSARWNYIDDFGYYGLELSTGGVYDIELSYLRNWYIGSVTDLQSIYFRAPNSSYRVGYDQGYTDGLGDNSYVQEAFQNGQDLGFKNGFEKGKIYGIEHANDYSFTGLLSAVFDVPIKAFRGLLNFEVLGVNLSGFYLSLLTACFVLVVIKLVM